jgi:D-alanyl-D-alanine carboxypeptidase
MNEKFRRSRKKRVNPVRMALFLIVAAAIVCAAIWGGKGIGENLFHKEKFKEVDPDASARESEAAGEDASPSEYARFSELYYYEEERLDRYLNYEAAHPELSPEEVVWRVDVDIDKAFYEDAVEIGDAHAEQALVSKHFKLPDDFEPAELAKIDGGCLVTPATKEAYERLRADAEAAGHAIRAASAYRSIDYQANLYARYLKEDPNNADNYSARPGHSEHHTGRAIDLVGPSGTLRGFAGTKEAERVRENAWQYGFIVRYTPENEEITGYESEPWHITYIGRKAAALMRENGIGSLEEYVAKYVLHLPPQ